MRRFPLLLAEIAWIKLVFAGEIGSQATFKERLLLTKRTIQAKLGYPMELTLENIDKFLDSGFADQKTPTNKNHNDSFFCIGCTECSYCGFCKYCDYCNSCDSCKECTDCIYCLACSYCIKCTNCIRCNNLKNCKNCTYSKDCKDCVLCVNCIECIKCDHLIYRQYCILNKQFTKEEYYRIKEGFGL